MSRKTPHQYASLILTKCCGKCNTHVTPIGGSVSKRYGWMCSVCSDHDLPKVIGPGLSYDNRYTVGPREHVSKHFRKYPPGIDPLTGRPWETK
jgi:hypothetical protein